MTTVVKCTPRKKNWTLYIGRAFAGLPASKWANHFDLRRYTRDQSLTNYEKYIRGQAILVRDLHEIDDQALGCWCHNKAFHLDRDLPFCHGDVLIKLRREQLAIGTD